MNTNNNECYLEIHAGAGGHDAQDWAQTLKNMYIKWAINHNYNYEIIEEYSGEKNNTIKYCTIKISGKSTYDYLKFENGIHRIIRISKYNSNSKRQTSFASVKILPKIDNQEIEIQEKDIKIDTFKSSGPGGQHVNTTESAVRITHMPTKLSVQCQNSKSQHKNKAEALKILKLKLLSIKIEKIKKNNNTIHKNSQKITWSNQIRSYILHPYKLVRDNRSKIEKNNVMEILKGNIDEFLPSLNTH